ncbi:hypothetical protein BT96DRAFT_926005 [Gymnopus androsaceus JB14]|uniref:F-box domain-containing protein n=1 Tax=Gymnopus androsaceus JB14 TaxID=1447944 RepID=A0A6A4GXR4_9AGAR|nr:hypothetical protein BT96DRAFT_926005 [Gymnopus androsaceus JB14]
MARYSLRIKEKQTSGESSMQDGGEISSVGEASIAQDDDYEGEEPDELAEGPSRKRARKSSKKTHSKSHSNEDDPSAEFSPKKKKKKRMPEQFRKVRGKLGMLERLAKDVPLDVIFEIFSYLDPSDLLRLARTSNDLRGILMSKTSESIWRTARSNVCNHKGRCDTVYWSFRMRFCRSCATTFPDSWDETYRSSVPADFFRCEIMPREHTKGSARKDNRVVGNFEIAELLKQEYEALQTPEDRTAWLTRKSQERDAIDEHGRLCEEWHQARLEKRGDELSHMREQRKNAILDRLEEIGWREEAEKIIATSSYGWDDFTSHKLVKQTKKLTDYGWNSIKAELVQMLSTHKTSRLVAERRRILIQRYASLKKECDNIRSASDLRDPFPAVGDILTHKVFEDLIWDTPEDEELTNAFFQSKLSEHLPGIIDEWRPAKVQELLEVMRRSVPTATVAELQLATSVFSCTRCLDIKMYYPQMFYHHCFTGMSYTGNTSSNERSSYVYPNGPWMSLHIRFCDRSSRIAKTIVEACSLDPATSTIQDMYSANPLIECSGCYNAPNVSYDHGRAFMRWPYAIYHASFRLFSSPDHTLATNSFGEETEKILACEPEHRCADAICCAHCNEILCSSTITTVLEHLKAAHSNTIDVETLDASPAHKLRDECVQEHWYWNPRANCGLMTQGIVFRYKSVSAQVDTASYSTLLH